MEKVQILYLAADHAERQKLTTALIDRGFQVTAVDSGQAGLETFVAGVHQVLLCDLALPDLDGQTVLKGVRQCCSETPIVLLTTRETVSKAVEAVKLGAQHFLVKPVTVDEVEIAIAESIRHVELKRELAKHQRDLEELVKERTDRLEYANRQLSALNEVSRQLNKFVDEDSLLDELPNLLTSTLDFDRASLWLDMDEGLTLRAMSFRNDPPELIANFKRMVDTGELPEPPHLRQCLSERRSVFIPDLNADPRWPRREGEVIRTKAILMVPVIRQGQAIGLLLVNMQHHERKMDDQDIARVETFASMVGLALDNLRAYQTLEKKVIERTASLGVTNEKLRVKARQLEDSALQLGRANVELLAIKEELEAKQEQADKLLTQLSRSRNELRAILDSSSDAIVMVNRENKIVIASRRIEELFGCRVQEVVGQPLEQFAEKIAGQFESPRDFMNQLTRDAESAEAPWLSSDLIYSKSLRTAGDLPLDLVIGWIAVDERSGSDPGRVWVFVDVTALMRADEQLRTIIDASPVPLIVSRVDDGLIKYANKHLARLVGWETKELIGQMSPDFYEDPEDRKVVIERLTRDGYLENHEVRLRRKDGRIIWCLFSLVTSVVAGEQVIIGGLYDISERKEAEEKLRLYSRIFDTSHDGVLVFDPNGKLITRNPAHARLTGLTDADIEGKRVVDLVPEKAREAILDGIAAGGTFRDIVEFPTADGRTLAIDLSVFHIRDPQGEIMYSVGMGRDVTERRQAQQVIQKTLGELEEANTELKNAQTQLVQSEKMASLGLLVAGIAHEINTPVGAISSMHNTLIRAVDKLKQSLMACDIAAHDSDQMKPILEVIDNANRVIDSGAERVTTIVRRLRSFARLDEAALKEVDIHEGIEDTLTLIHHEIKGRVEVVRQYGDLPPITCYPGRLNQVFLNLLNNARQAIDGPGTVTISTAIRNNQVEIKFKDSGKGIAPESLSRIFDPGFTTKGVGVGTGLGLSICYRIIEDHMGEIKVESEVGKGTIFTIILPLNLDELVENGT